MYATLEEAWGSKLGSPSTSPVAWAGATTPEKKAKARAKVQTPLSGLIQPEDVRLYVNKAYAKGGIKAVEGLFDPEIVAGIRGSCYSFLKDPEKILMVIAGLFVFIVFVDALCKPRYAMPVMGGRSLASLNSMPW